MPGDGEGGGAEPVELGDEAIEIWNYILLNRYVSV
jgi:hypothetical protein